MNKISAFILMVLSLFVLSSNVFVFAEDTFAGASYVVQEVLEENDLLYGVNHQKVKAQTSTSFSTYDVDGSGILTGNVVPGKLYDQQVNILEIPSNDKVKVTTWANLSGNRWSLATVRALIGDYELKNPGWKVIAAINGDFFDIGGKGNLPYQANGALVSGGEFYKTTTSRQVGFTNNGTENSLIGNELVERTDKMILSIYNNDGEIIKEFDIDNINKLPGDGESSVYYAVYGSDKKIIPVEVETNGYFVDKAELALPNNANDFYGRGVISSLEAKTITAGQFAIVSNNEEINDLLGLDVKIRVQYKFNGAYEGVNDMTGGGDTIMKNGEISGAGPEDRAPRTVIGKKEDGTIVMMVVDGRQSQKGMFGADRTEIGAIMHHYGAVEAYNLDGGGSSTMIIRKNGKLEVMNSPSDGSERTDANAILIVTKDPMFEFNYQAEVNSLELDVNLLDANGHDIKELYFTLNNERKLVKDNKVKFENLESNTEYTYEIDYVDSDGLINKLITSGSAKTLKLNPTFTRLEVSATGEMFFFKIIYDDADRAGNFDQAEITLDGKYFGTLFKDTKEISRNLISKFDKIVLTVRINVGDGKSQTLKLEFEDFEVDRSVDAYIRDIFDLQNKYINRIFN